jgi:hypothetical protein
MNYFLCHTNVSSDQDFDRIEYSRKETKQVEDWAQLEEMKVLNFGTSYRILCLELVTKSFTIMNTGYGATENQEVS